MHLGLGKRCPDLKMFLERSTSINHSSVHHPKLNIFHHKQNNLQNYIFFSNPIHWSVLQFRKVSNILTKSHQKPINKTTQKVKSFLKQVLLLNEFKSQGKCHSNIYFHDLSNGWICLGGRSGAGTFQLRMQQKRLVGIEFEGKSLVSICGSFVRKDRPLH